MIGAVLAWSAYNVTNNLVSSGSAMSPCRRNLLTGLVTSAQVVVLIPVTLLFELIRHSEVASGRLAAVSFSVAVSASIAGNTRRNGTSRLVPLTMVGQMTPSETLFALLYGFLTSALC